MKTITFLVGLSLLFNANSQINSNPGTNAWSSPAAWNGGIVPSATDVVNIVSNSTIILDLAVVHNADININNGGTLSSVILANDLTVNNSKITLIGFGASVNFIGSGSAVPITINNGHLINGGVFMSGNLYILNPNSSPTSVNNGDFMVQGTMEIDGALEFVNNLSANVSSQFLLNNGTTFTNNQSCSINSIANYGTFTNLGSTNISDSLTNYNTGVITSSSNNILVTNNALNDGMITISDSLAIGGDFINIGTITNVGGAVNITNDLLNSGTITGSSNGNYYIGANSENTSSGIINGIIDICDATLVPSTYLDIDNGMANIDFNTVTFCTTSYAGIEENNLISISLYPNPSYDGNIKINYSGVLTSIKVSDMYGRIISLPIDVSSGTINGSSLKSGKYIVNIIADNTNVTKEFVVFN